MGKMLKLNQYMEESENKNIVLNSKLPFRFVPVHFLYLDATFQESKKSALGFLIDSAIRIQIIR